MYALKCANSVPQPMAPSSVDRAKVPAHSSMAPPPGKSRRRTSAWPTTTRRPISASAVIGRKCIRMLSNERQNRSMLKSWSWWTW